MRPGLRRMEPKTPMVFCTRTLALTHGIRRNMRTRETQRRAAKLIARKCRLDKTNNITQPSCCLTPRTCLSLRIFRAIFAVCDYEARGPLRIGAGLSQRRCGRRKASHKCVRLHLRQVQTRRLCWTMQEWRYSPCLDVLKNAVLGSEMPRRCQWSLVKPVSTPYFVSLPGLDHPNSEADP